MNHVNNVVGQTGENFLLHVTDTRTDEKWLVDGGALLSILPPTLQQLRQGPNGVELRAANGTKIPCYGTINRTITIGTQNFSFDFTIAAVSQRILGADFLANFYLAPNHRDAQLISLQDYSTLPAQHARGVKTIPVNFVSQMDDPFYKLLDSYPEILTPSFTIKEPTHGVKHYIPTDGPPVQSRSRRLDPEKLAVAKAELGKLEALGICYRGRSEWASPLLVTTKPCGGWRVCGDYRRLNAMTTDDRYPVRTLQDFTTELHGKKFFSKIDLLKGYHQIPVSDGDIPKTAVITPFGLYVFPRTPFGLKNAGQDFQRLMDEILGDLPRVFVYIDDILVASNTLEEHLADLKQVFETLAANGLVVQRPKCVLGKQSIEFLGYHVDQTGISPLPDRVIAIKATKPPTTIKELQRFLGMVGYYRRFIPNAAAHLYHLFESLKGPKSSKPKTLNWTPDCQASFESTKNALADATLLFHPRPEAQLAITTDASNVAIGGVLEQRGPMGWEPLAFYSSKLEPNQQQWPPYDRELLAAFKATRHFKSFVEGHTFTLYTDHQSLVPSIHKKTDPQTLRQTYQLACIAEFTTDVRYVEGKANLVADALSRPNEDLPDISAIPSLAYSPDKADFPPLGTSTSMPGTSSTTSRTGSAAVPTASQVDAPTTSSIRNAQTESSTAASGTQAAPRPEMNPADPSASAAHRAASAAKSEAAASDLNSIIAAVGDLGINWEEIASQTPLDPEFRRIRNDQRSGMNFKKIDIGTRQLIVDISNGLPRPFIPQASRRRIFDVFHGLGHPGVARTRQIICSKVVWPSIRSDVSKWSRECLHCQQAKVTKNVVPPIGDFSVPSRRFEHVNIDLVTLPVSNGFRYVLTAVDRFTRWPVAVPIVDSTTQSVVDAIAHGWIQQFGVPTTITSDRGAQFQSAIFQQLARIWGIKHVMTAPYHPEANGLVERFHRRLKEALIALGSEAPHEWFWKLPMAMLSIRTTLKPDIGASPADLVYGEGLAVPGELLPANPATDAQMLQQRRSALSDMRLEVARLQPTETSAHRTPLVHMPVELKNCTHVFIRRGNITTSLASPYLGPYRVVSRNNQNFRVAIPGRGTETVAISRVKPAICSADDAQDAEPGSPPPPGRPPRRPASPVVRQPRRSRRRRPIIESDDEFFGDADPAPPISPWQSPPQTPRRTHSPPPRESPPQPQPQPQQRDWFDYDKELDDQEPPAPQVEAAKAPQDARRPHLQSPTHPAPPQIRLFSRPAAGDFSHRLKGGPMFPNTSSGAAAEQPEVPQRPPSPPRQTHRFSKPGPKSFSRRRRPDISALTAFLSTHLDIPLPLSTSRTSHMCSPSCESPGSPRL